MTGQRQVIAAALAAARSREPGVLATVVRVEGSAYRRPGARMFLPGDGVPVGLVSGGCLEQDLAERATAVLTANEPRTVLYDMRSPDDLVWGLGLGCNGAIRVLLEPLGATAAGAVRVLEFLADCDRQRRAGIVATVFDVQGRPGVAVGDSLLVDADGVAASTFADEMLTAAVLELAREQLAARRSRIASVDAGDGVVDLLVEYIGPALRLVVCGGGLDAVPVVDQAGALGWNVEVLDHRPVGTIASLFRSADRVRQVDWSHLRADDPPLDERTATVLMTHHFLHDLEILAHLAQREAPGREPRYVGLLGPRQRADNLVSELAQRGVVLSDTFRQCLHGPVGLDVGSETPEEIALSLVAEIQAVFSGRDGGPLRERDRPLHDGASE